jgi:hypothetical protein
MEKVVLGTGRHKKRYLVLGVGYSSDLNATAAQDLAAYTVFSGKVKKVHKVSQVIYKKLVPLSQAIYFPRPGHRGSGPQGQAEVAQTRATARECFDRDRPSEPADQQRPALDGDGDQHGVHRLGRQVRGL